MILAFCCINRPVCPPCHVETVWLFPRDGAPIHARLYVPNHVPGRNLPAVVVCHGYLGNAAFLENPWAEDLTSLGMAALFIDRRGHGRSGGNLGGPPQADRPVHLTQLYPDIQTALSYLRGSIPLVDSRRIAILGHSDGGTGAITVGSADWEVAATVSLAASVGPWEYVNHIVPKNFLLLYGQDDQFIVAESDVLLIASATRGRVLGEGTVGRFSDGSARRLLRVPGRGHVDLPFSRKARRVALHWLQSSFGLHGDIRLAKLPWPGVIASVVSLLIAVALWNGIPAKPTPRRSWRRLGPRLIAIAAAWVVALGFASWLSEKLPQPAREGNIVFGLLIAQSLAMGTMVLLLGLGREKRSRSDHSPRPHVLTSWRHGGDRSSSARSVSTDIARGAVAAVVVQALLETAFRPVYTTMVDWNRTILFLGFLAFAVPAFLATCTAADRGRNAVAGSPEAMLAVLTALTANLWFVRMSMFPVLVLALILLFVAAYRVGGRSTLAAATFGAVMYARSASVVCALY